MMGKEGDLSYLKPSGENNNSKVKDINSSYLMNSSIASKQFDLVAPENVPII